MKNLKLFGMALLVAGLSFVTASCTKQAPEVSQNAEFEAPAADLSEFTKASEQLLAVSADSVKYAIDEIIKNLEKELEKAGQAHNDAVDSLHVFLFRTLTSFCDYHRFDKFKFKDEEGIYMAWYKLLIGKQDGSGYVTLKSKNGRLLLETKTGYYLSVDLPSWAASLFEKDGKFDVEAQSGVEFVIEIGYGDRVYAQTVIDAGDRKVMTFVYDTNKVAVAGSCWVLGGEDYLWYNNTEVAGENPTNLRIYDVSVLSKDLSLMKSEFTYTQPEAQALVEEFNNNVTADAVTPACALLAGKEFKAVIDGPTQAGFYRAILKWGDQFVPAQEVSTLVGQWLEKVLEEEM